MTAKEDPREGDEGTEMLTNVIPATINTLGSRWSEEPPTMVQKEILMVPMVDPVLDLNIFSPTVVESQPHHTQTGPMGSEEGAQAISLLIVVGSQSKQPQQDRGVVGKMFK